ncbi:MAG: hypothetical protein JST89_09650 [Cyanobacteria bacterium SZAS-4]|nr:hypothetical protein [Cyanobacteria bacterium SZAS-4]
MALVVIRGVALTLLAINLAALPPAFAGEVFKSAYSQSEAAVYFDPTRWNANNFHLGGGNRAAECAKLLRQYDLIGMSRAEIHLLLGEKSPTKWDKKHTVESYIVSYSCTHDCELKIRYAKNNRVDGYAITSRQDKLPRFIVTNNVKPSAHESLRDFFVRNAESDPYHMFYYPE